MFRWLTYLDTFKYQYLIAYYLLLRSCLLFLSTILTIDDSIQRDSNKLLGNILIAIVNVSSIVSLVMSISNDVDVVPADIVTLQTELLHYNLSQLCKNKHYNNSC